MGRPSMGWRKATSFNENPSCMMPDVGAPTSGKSESRTCAVTGSAFWVQIELGGMEAMAASLAARVQRHRRISLVVKLTRVMRPAHRIGEKRRMRGQSHKVLRHGAPILSATPRSEMVLPQIVAVQDKSRRKESR